MLNKKTAKEIGSLLSKTTTAFEKIILSRKTWLEMCLSIFDSMKKIDKMFSEKCLTCERQCEMLTMIKESAELASTLASM